MQDKKGDWRVVRSDCEATRTVGWREQMAHAIKLHLSSRAEPGTTRETSAGETFSSRVHEIYLAWARV